MRHTFGALMALAIGWGLCAPSSASAQELFPLQANPPPATNCPQTAPPEAVAAGYTTLMHCIDGASTYYGNTANWLSCPEQTATAPEFFGSMTDSTNTLTCAEVITQGTDPATGHTVLDLHWPSAHGGSGPGAGYLKMTSNGGSRGNIEYAQGGLVEIRSRLTPKQTSGATYPGPAFFSWHTYLPPLDVTNGPAPLEDDYIEWYSGLHSDMAVHDWGQYRQTSATANGTSGTNSITLTGVSGDAITAGATGLPTTPQCLDGPPYPSTGFSASIPYYIWTYNSGTGVATLSSQEGGLVPANLVGNVTSTTIYLNDCSDGWYPGDESPYDITQQHTFGLLTTTDGSTFLQKIGYADHVMMPLKSGNAGVINPGEYDFSNETFHYTEPKEFRWWIGGTGGTGLDTDQYVEYIAIWGKSTCIPAGTDPTCTGTKVTPSTVVISR